MITAAGALRPTKHLRALYDCCRLFFATKIQSTLKKFDETTAASFTPQFLVDILSLHVDKAKQLEINQRLDALFVQYEKDNRLADTMRKLLESAKSTGDFILSVRDSAVAAGRNTPISVHLGLLAARCSYFAPIFVAKKQASSKDLLEPIDVAVRSLLPFCWDAWADRSFVQTWRLLIEHLYVGDLSVGTDDESLPEKLLAGAKTLQMSTPDFSRALEIALSSALTPASVMNYLTHAKSPMQKNAALRYIAGNLPKMLELGKVKELSTDLLLRMMRDFDFSDSSPKT